MKKLLFPFLFALVILSSCKDDKEEKCVFKPDISGISFDLKVESLEDSLPAIGSKKELVSFLTHHPHLKDFFGRSAYPSDSIFVNELYRMFKSPGFDTLLMETHKLFGDPAELKGEFTQAFANIKYYYPDFKPPKIQTIISGLQTDMMVSDTLIVIGLDFFLGKEAKYRPKMYSYQLRRYQRDFIVPSIMLLYGIDPRYNVSELSDKTVLAEMLTYGKAYYFAKHMLPCLPDSVLMGYTREETQGVLDNENEIYARLIDNEVMYSTSHQTKQRYIGERPKTLEIGEKCPGRIGTWIGWRITDAFARRNPDKTLPQIMAIANADKIFKEAKYRPEKK